VRRWRDRLFVNVASAGLPKDGDPRAHYAIFTRQPGGWSVRSRRVAFDVDRVEKQIRTSGMPGAKERIAVLRRHRYKQLGDHTI
jgi:diadenosine tetraphosphatase ApaH/serine/threonine PP2A family protein phosphatase